MKTLFILGLTVIVLLLFNILNKKKTIVFDKSKEPQLIFSKINQKSLNKMPLTKEQKRRLIEIKLSKMKFASF